MNDFGAYGGGRIWRDKTFFFAGYEGLRLPKQTTLVESVPSMALRAGDLSVYSKSVYAPGTGVAYPNNQIPASQISPVSMNALKYLFPLPNTGAGNAISNNFVLNMPTPISSDQADLRFDQNISSKQSAFARGHLQNSQCFSGAIGIVVASRLRTTWPILNTRNRLRLCRCPQLRYFTHAG